MLNTACANGDFQLPIPLQHDQDFPILQYDDDTLICMQGDISQMIYLKNLLQQFGESTGLKVNFDKSFMVPIDVSDDRFQLLATTFGCSKGSLLFTI